MSRRDREPFDDRNEDGSGWQEPAHLGGGSGQGDAGRDDIGRDDISRDDIGRAELGRDDVGPGARGDEPAPAVEPSSYQQPAPPNPDPQFGGGLFGRRRRTPGEVEKVFAYQGDTVSAQAWAVQHGWTVSDGNAPEDAVLQQLVATAPVRPSKDHRPASVLRGRYGQLELVAFDVVYASGRYLVPEWAVTAAPLLAPPPALRLSPARFWKHRTGGLVQVPSGDPEFDARWVLLAAEDGPAVRRLVEDPTLRGLLLGTDDGDEFWSVAAGGAGGAGSFIAAIRPDGHRPELLEHHARLLSTLVGALAAGV